MMIPRHKGLTLIELMATIAIIAIVASIAWPAYQRQSQKNLRTDAIIALTSGQLAMQQYKSDNGNYDVIAFSRYLPQYADTPTSQCKNRGFKSTAESCDGHYNLTAIITNGGQGYVLSATPRAGTKQENDECGTLTINHLNVRGVNNVNPNFTANRCWSN